MDEEKPNPEESREGNTENNEVKEPKAEQAPESNGENKEEDGTSPEEKEVQSLRQEAADLKDKYLRLYSEFDNFRRRTAKERMELLKTANEDVLASLLPVLDDFERARKAFKESPENKNLLEGIELIYNKLFKTLESKGLKPMESIGQEFNSELHEAITQIPAPSEELKGKIIDEVEKGYYLNEKVIRFAKVIIGS